MRTRNNRAGARSAASPPGKRSSSGWRSSRLPRWRASRKRSTSAWSHAPFWSRAGTIPPSCPAPSRGRGHAGHRPGRSAAAESRGAHLVPAIASARRHLGGVRSGARCHRRMGRGRTDAIESFHSDESGSSSSKRVSEGYDVSHRETRCVRAHVTAGAIRSYQSSVSIRCCPRACVRDEKRSTRVPSAFPPDSLVLDAAVKRRQQRRVGIQRDR